jgi:hypothetical protein
MISHDVCQGRDLGFNTVLGFFSKLSSGTGTGIQLLAGNVWTGNITMLSPALCVCGIDEESQQQVRKPITCFFSKRCNVS